MAKRVCPNGHVTKDKKALKCAQCGADLPLAPKRKRIGLWILVGLVALVIIIAATSKGGNDGTTAGARATSTPRPTAAPTATLSPADQLTAIVEKKNPGDPVTGIYVPGTSTEPTTYDATIFVKTILTAKGAIQLAATYYLEAAEAAFAADPELGLFTCIYTTTFTDAYGKESELPFLRIELSRETADKMVWDNVLPCGLTKIADVWNVHRSMEADWAANCQ